MFPESTLMFPLIAKLGGAAGCPLGASMDARRLPDFGTALGLPQPIETYLELRRTGGVPANRRPGSAFFFGIARDCRREETPSVEIARTGYLFSRGRDFI